jgi:hypothetical protein
MDNQYQQSWQQPYLSNTQPTQPMSANGQGPISQSHQFPDPQTQAATYTSNSTTTTQQQTATTTSNHLNNAYIPAYQQPVSPNPQYTGQPQNLLYQQQAVSQCPQETTVSGDPTTASISAATGAATISAAVASYLVT